jgi:hypothetical protein
MSGDTCFFRASGHSAASTPTVPAAQILNGLAKLLPRLLSTQSGRSGHAMALGAGIRHIEITADGESYEHRT